MTLSKTIIDNRIKKVYNIINTNKNISFMNDYVSYIITFTLNELSETQIEMVSSKQKENIILLFKKLVCLINNGTIEEIVYMLHEIHFQLFIESWKLKKIILDKNTIFSRLPRDIIINILNMSTL